MKVSFLLLLTALLTGCMLGPDYQRPEPPAMAAWHAGLEGKTLAEPSLADMAWLEIFRDEQLQSMLQQALTGNKNLLIAMERIEEARALYRINRAPLFPQFDLETTAERERTSALTSTESDIDNEYFFGPALSWELDLWGKNRRQARVAYARYLATEYGAQAVRLSLIADLCRAYFELEGVNGRLTVNRSTLDARLKSLDIAQKRFRGGLTSRLEVRQAEVEAAASKASLPKVQQRKVVAENELAILMGMAPQPFNLEGALRKHFIPPTVTAGLPSQLLERRPDIMQAEQQLIAQSEAIGVAKARLFPSIALTGQYGTETAQFSDLLDSDGKYWIIELDLLMPLFNAGGRRAELTAAESRFNQARLAYEQIVLEAMREVSNALNQFHRSGETLEAELALEQATRDYLSLATKRYRNGVLAYIDVLDAQRQLFDAQIAVNLAREAQLLALVDLYKALGGGWEPTVVTAGN